MNCSVAPIKKPAVFLDRDGVINRKLPEGDYVKDWSEFSFLPGALRAIRILKENGFLIAVITNQRCIATGIITEEGLKSIHERMLYEIRGCGGDIDAIYFCPHDISDGCVCRKPEPGMILRAIKDFKGHNIDIDLERSCVIGDSERDIIPAKVLGLKAIKIGEYSPEADINKRDLLEAVEAIIECD
jgi:D-glycero-D-manno-heptose 1,7-bisphosphate phosphatase